jgi:predicted AAA+ superfamily ATPase
MNYITLLEQAFIVFRLTPLYSNKIKEINKSHKIYFYDTGVRNAIIGNFEPLELRTDKGALFENFFIAEKVKTMDQNSKNVQKHFWRNRQGSEVDYIEIIEGGKQIFAYECKWTSLVKSPISFVNSYPNAKFKCINRGNILNHFIKP